VIRSDWLGDAASAALALVLGLMVWLVAQASAQPMDEVTLPAPGSVLLALELRDVPDGLAAFDPSVTRARVRLRGVPSGLATVREDDLSAWADLHDVVASPGRVRVAVHAACDGCVGTGVRVVRVIPAEITVRVEEATTKEVSVRAELTDGALAACREVDAEVQPAAVVLRGAASVIEQVSGVVARVSAIGSDTAEPSVAGVPVVAVDREGNEVTAVEAVPSSVSVGLGIVDRDTCAEVSVRPVYNEPPSGYYVAEISVSPRRVELRGDPDTLDEIRLEGVVLTEVIDISDSRQQMTTAAPLDLPTGVMPVGAHDTVTVTIGVSPFPGTRSVDLAVATVGVSAGLKVAAVSPAAVQVLLSGPLPALNELDPSALRATLDVTGLGPGAHRVRPRISLPTGIRARSTTPPDVDVRLEARGSRSGGGG